jgi:CheY-like chemotaxis protein
MQPFGVETVTAPHAQAALDAIESDELHAAVVDLATPRAPGRPSPANDPGGLWLLANLARARRRPPVIVVDSRVVTPAQVHRALHHALRLGAFSVVRRPVELEQLLAVIQRLVDRHFQGAWPGGDRA